MNKKEAVEILKSKVCDDSLEWNECIDVVVKALENSDDCTNDLKHKVGVFKETFNELNSNKPSAEELDEIRKSEIRFVVLDAFVKGTNCSDYFDNDPLKMFQKKLDACIGNIQSYCEKAICLILDTESDTQNAKYEVSRVKGCLEEISALADSIESTLNDYMISEIKKYLD